MTKQIEQKYQELILSVVAKFPNESRHQTALRYIRAAGKTCECQPQKAKEASDKPVNGRLIHEKSIAPDTDSD